MLGLISQIGPTLSRGPFQFVQLGPRLLIRAQIDRTGEGLQRVLRAHLLQGHECLGPQVRHHAVGRTACPQGLTEQALADPEEASSSLVEAGIRSSSKHLYRCSPYRPTISTRCSTNSAVLALKPT